MVLPSIVRWPRFVKVVLPTTQLRICTPGVVAPKSTALPSPKVMASLPEGFRIDMFSKAIDVSVVGAPAASRIVIEGSGEARNTLPRESPWRVTLRRGRTMAST